MSSSNSPGVTRCRFQVPRAFGIPIEVDAHSLCLLSCYCIYAVNIRRSEATPRKGVLNRDLFVLASFERSADGSGEMVNTQSSSACAVRMRKRDWLSVLRQRKRMPGVLNPSYRSAVIADDENI
jgi:hypothetical protein